MTDLIKEISDLREENQTQKEEIKLKSLVREKYETELFKFRHESFLQPEFQGTQQFSEALVNLLKKGRDLQPDAGAFRGSKTDS